MTAAKTTTKPRATRAKKADKPDKVSFADMPRKVNARFDNAQTTSDNMRHWGAADGMSPDSAYSPEVRKILRERARLEVENSPFARGIVQTKVNDVVGTGPRLQMMTGDEKFNERFEAEFQAWAREIRLGEKLITLQSSKMIDGESFAEMVTNMGIEGHVKLDLELIECDRITRTVLGVGKMNDPTDGIDFDQWGNPSFYTKLITHPGDWYNFNLADERVPARFMIHHFKRLRPEQHRGVSEFAPVLNLFAELRRYTSAVISAAETAADFAAVLETMQPPEEMAYGNPFESLEINKRMMTTLPDGYTLKQFKAEQPTAQYKDFVRAIGGQVGRAFNMPMLVAMLDASGYNFASAKIDTRSYIRELHIEQYPLECIMDRVLRMFALELSSRPGFRKAADVVNQHAWMWEQPAEVDPRESGAIETKLRSMQTTLYQVYAAKGQDWMTDGIEQIAREKEAIKKYIGSVLTEEGDSHHKEEDEDVSDDSDED
jgi:hypothetical protein